MGARHARAAHNMTIAFIFCACSPLISIVALVWFVLGGSVYRWLILFSETKKADLGGAFWVGAIRHLYFSLGMYVTLMFFILIDNPWGEGVPTLIVAICGVYVLYKYMGFQSIVWKSMPFEAVVDSEEWQSKQARSSNRRLSLSASEAVHEYKQTECVEAEVNATLMAQTDAESDASIDVAKSASVGMKAVASLAKAVGADDVEAGSSGSSAAAFLAAAPMSDGAAPSSANVPQSDTHA